MLKLCEEINDACAIIDKTLGWPGFLHCFNQQGKGHRFPSSCRNSITEIQFNATSQCVAPLIAVSDPDSWYEETECGLQCRDPLFTKSELDRVSVFIFVLGWSNVNFFLRLRIISVQFSSITSDEFYSLSFLISRFVPYDDRIHHFHLHHRLEEGEFLPTFSPLLPQPLLFRRNLGLDGSVLSRLKRRHRLSKRCSRPSNSFYRRCYHV